MTVFADTFALIAWLNPRDNDHARVTPISTPSLVDW
jgi:hypothetical protein